MLGAVSESKILNFARITADSTDLAWFMSQSTHDSISSIRLFLTIGIHCIEDVV